MLLLSGSRGSGKSTLLLNVADEIRRRPADTSVTLGGVVSIRVPTGIDITFLSGGLPSSRTAPQPTAPLARYRWLPHADGTTDDGQFVFLGPYRFSPTTIETVNRHLSSIADDSDRDQFRGGVVVDEIGPLELKHREGFLPGFSRLLHSPLPLVVVVRPELVDLFSEWTSREGRAPALVISDPHPRDETVRTIVEYIVRSVT